MRFYYSALLLLSLMIFVKESAFAANITYHIEPLIVDDSLGPTHAIDGGFITTDGTLGPLSKENILEYEVTVSASGVPVELWGFFTSDDPLADLRIFGQVIATDKTIEVPGILPSALSGNSLSFSDRTLSSVEWVNTQSTPPGEPFSVIRIGIINAVAVELHDFSSPNPTITVARVPEPQSLVLSLIGAWAVCGLARKTGSHGTRTSARLLR